MSGFYSWLSPVRFSSWFSDSFLGLFSMLICFLCSFGLDRVSQFFLIVS